MRKCLVLGAAACLWEDIDKALSIGGYDAVIAAKLAGIAWPGELHSWVTLHPEWMAGYRKRRADKGYPEPRETVGNGPGKGVDRVADARWPEQRNRSGSSGMFAAKVALDEGFERIVLCGIPMTQQVGRIDGRDGWPAAKTYRAAVLRSKHRLIGKVRSVSGWTEELLGSPDPEWLQGKQPEASALRAGRPQLKSGMD